MGASCERGLKKGQGLCAVREGKRLGGVHSVDLAPSNPPQRSRDECTGMGPEKGIAFKVEARGEGEGAQVGTEGRLCN